MKRIVKSLFSSRALVPWVFSFLCLVGIYYSGKPLSFIIGGVIERFLRNAFLVTALILPVIAGIGLNFSIVLGAMAAQMALIFVVDRGGQGPSGLVLSFLLSIPLASGLGYLIGRLFNRARGREMVTGLIASFFANGVYQLLFLFGAGTLIPVLTSDLLLPRGSGPDGQPIMYGLRNTVDLGTMQYALDDLGGIQIGWGVGKLPIVPVLGIALACLFIFWILRTRLGQQMRAMGQDFHIAEVSGIPVHANRLWATIISTVMAAWGQIFFLQNMGTINTYSSHEQVGMFSIAALLVSGASVSKATIGQALFGTLIFQTLFLVSPLAGNTLFGNAQIGEYFRVFVAYGVIAIALLMHAWSDRRKSQS